MPVCASPSRRVHHRWHTFGLPRHRRRIRRTRPRSWTVWRSAAIGRGGHFGSRPRPRSPPAGSASLAAAESGVSWGAIFHPCAGIDALALPAGRFHLRPATRIGPLIMPVRFGDYVETCCTGFGVTLRLTPTVASQRYRSGRYRGAWRAPPFVGLYQVDRQAPSMYAR
jgi:hypothetical protein